MKLEMSVKGEGSRSVFVDHVNNLEWFYSRSYHRCKEVEINFDKVNGA